MSISAMAYRCKDLRILGNNEAFQLCEQSILSESIKMLIERWVQTKRQIEDVLALNLSDIERLCGLSEGYLDTRVVPFQPRLSET